MHIVVLAYGPGQLTKRASSRARKLTGGAETVSVVPATRASQDSTNDTKVGRAALRAVLTELPDEPTLIIHDDAVITTRGIMALQRALDDGNRFVVPYTNDPNTDHFMGPLPTGKAAERSLDQTSIPKMAKPATEIRLTCVAARRDDLLELLVEPIADPYATIQSGNYVFMVAGGAAVSHSSECLSRMVDDDQDERPLLVAALIVKNEEKMLPGCLESLQLICDRVEVCDTGSTDNTIAIARAAGANVIERDWPDDFGEARNYVLEQCRDARYILVIDADERVRCSNPEETRRHLATYSTEHSAFNVDVTNLSTDGNELYSLLSVRLFQGLGTEYRGALHEVVYRTEDSAPLSGNYLNRIKVDHYGYSQEVIVERSKSSRNLDLAEAQYEKAGDARAAVHLARSLSYAGESPERALELLEDGLAEVGDTSATTRAQILTLMADRCLELNHDQRAFDLAREALELMPVDDTAAGLLSTAAQRLQNYDDFIAVAEGIRSADSPREVVRVDRNRMIYRNHLAAAYAITDRPDQAVAEAFDILADYPDEFHMWAPLVECLDRGYGTAAIELLAPLAVKDPTGGFLEPIIKRSSTETTSSFCALYVSLGGTIPEATRVGLLSAAMSGNRTAFTTLAGAAGSLDSETRAELADRIETQGHPDLATQLKAKSAPAKV